MELRIMCRVRLYSALFLVCVAGVSVPVYGFQAPPAQEPNPITAETKTTPELSPEAQGDLYMAHQRYQAAIAAYRRAKPNALLLNKLGIASQQMLLMDEARKSYEASLKMDGHNPEVWNNLGTVYYALRQLGNAERCYRKAVKGNPRSAITAKNLGTVYMAMNKLEKGAQWYQQALALDPLVFEGKAQYRIGDPTSTQQMGAMNYYMARSFLAAGKLDKAIDYLRRSIDEGYTDGKHILADKQFSLLRESPAFQLMLSEQDQSRMQRGMRPPEKN